jgi:hypothetical protein
MDKKIDGILQRGKTLLSKKQSLNTVWQDIALNFYPQRAYFTIDSSTFEDGFNINQTLFADNLTTSYPIYVSRELTNAISTYLRPAGQEWFKAAIRNKKLDANLSNESRKYLEFVGDTMRWFMEDEATGFGLAMAQNDADMVCFGQGVISAEIDWNRTIPMPIFRCWFLRDLAWSEDFAGNVNFVIRSWKTKLRTAYGKFGDKLSAETIKRYKDNGDQYTIIYHIVLETKDYYDNYSNNKERKIKLPFTSIYIESDTGHEIECVGSPTEIYRVNRWERVSGSQYAQSPSVTGALPDARLLQTITLALLEAGEKAVSPPILAKQDVIRADIGLIANTVSWVKDDIEGSIDDNVRQMVVDKSGLGFGVQMQSDTREQIRKAFFLDKITLPVFDSRMTATEVRERVAEYIRSASPLFNSMITQVNQPMCKMIFRILESVGAFGPAEYIPEELRGPDGFLRRDIDFTFSSPLLEASGKEKVQKFLEMQGLLASAVNLDPNVALIPDANIALRDALDGGGIPAKWLKDEDVVAQMIANQQQAQQVQQFIQTLGAGGEAAQKIGQGAQAIQEAGIE